jgi:DNA-binding transcriptional ArsR family regulator
MKEGNTHKGTPWSQISAGLSEDEAAAQGNAFLVLRNKTRLRIIHMLRKHGGILCVSEIADVLDESPSVISSHLAILRTVGLVQLEKYHAYVYYTLKPGAMEQYKEYLDSLIK